MQSNEERACDDRQRSRKDWIDQQNIVIKNRPTKPQLSRSCSPDGRNKEDVGGRQLLRVPCGLSLSTLTGLSAASRVSRPCHTLNVTGQPRPLDTRTPSTLLNHGYEWVSCEDQKILNMMVMRREAQLEEQHLMLEAAKLWDQDRLQYNKMMNEKQKKWHETLMERRRLEKLELERRKEMSEQSYCQHIAELKRTIEERHAKSEQKLREISMHKSQPRGMTDADTEMHRLRRQQQQLQLAARSADHICEVSEKERRASDNLASILCSRDRTMQDRRRERERRMDAAQQARRALEDRYQEMCEETRQQLSSRMCLSECRHSDMVEWRKKMTHDVNINKELHHAQAMALISEEERVKEEKARHELMRKEARIRAEQMKREFVINRSREHALTTAALRMHIKQAYPLSI